MSVASALGVALGDDWTISLMWQADTAYNGLSIIEFVWGASGSGNNNTCLFGRDQANNRWIVFNSGFGSGQTVESITNGVWYNIQCVRSGSTISLYINGVLKGSVSVGAAGNRSLRLGTGNQSDAGWWLSGKIDCWYVWKEALDSTERSDVYNSGAGVEYPYSPVDYQISGVVTLNGTPVENATVRCIRQSDNVAITELSTDSSGEYLFEGLDESELYHLAVEYEADDVKYNAKSLWDIVPIEVE